MDFPILDRLSSLPEQYPVYDFSSTVLVAIQHLLSTNGSMFEVLNHAGLPYEQMFVLGKVYSTNQEVYHELKNRGVHVPIASVELEEAQLAVDYRL